MKPCEKGRGSRGERRARKKAALGTRSRALERATPDPNPFVLAKDFGL